MTRHCLSEDGAGPVAYLGTFSDYILLPSMMQMSSCGSVVRAHMTIISHT